MATTAIARLHDLADFTAARASAGATHIADHVKLYRDDAAWLSARWRVIATRWWRCGGELLAATAKAVSSATRAHAARVALAWGLWALVMLGLVVEAWLDYLLRQAGRPELVTMDIGVFTILGEVSAATVGVLLASRRRLLLALGCRSRWTG